MRMYSPHYIEYYADRFIELGLRKYGLTLDQYLLAPKQIELHYIEADPRPLLPAQREVMRRLKAEEAQELQRAAAEALADEDPLEQALRDFPRRDGRVIEPLHHCRRPKRTRKSDFTRRARHAG